MADGQTSLKISIIMPTRNRAHLLRQALDSCLNQTHTNIELIVVNDASSDATAEILKEYSSDTRLLTITNSSNVGLPRALNIGFAASRGDLLTWTSDDNYFAPHALERLHREFLRCPERELIYSDFSAVDEHGNSSPRTMDEPDYVIEKNCVGACFLYRRSVHERVGPYDASLLLAEDYDFFLRAYLAGCKMFYLREDLYAYSVHSGSLGATHGYDKVAAKTAEVRRLRMSPYRREWIRLRRRSRKLWSYLAPWLGR